MSEAVKTDPDWSAETLQFLSQLPLNQNQNQL